VTQAVLKQVVCRRDELAPGQVIGARLGPIPIVVIRAMDGSLHALAATCLHQGGPLHKGRLYEHTISSNDVGEYIVDKTREILKCPWHGYEYDIRTGATVFDSRRRQRTFVVSEEGDDIVAQL
jgi:nitrite reductase/ring-hydroxylating ferredoxin subunit